MNDPAGRWCAELSDALVDVGRRLGLLAERLSGDWPDAQGREWAERVTRLRHELGATAREADGLGWQLGAAADAGPRFPTGRVGVRLGGTDGSRPDPERGVRIAELPPPVAGLSGG